jgi:mRNA interferase MazF
VKRGDLVTACAGSGYAGKPRPVLIIQDDALAALDSVVVCPLTSSPQGESILRPLIRATTESGLAGDSLVMTDKVVAVPRHTLGQIIGRVDPTTLRKVMRGLGTVIGLGQGARR